jgi:hypothetical protein
MGRRTLSLLEYNFQPRNHSDKMELQLQVFHSTLVQIAGEEYHYLCTFEVPKFLQGMPILAGKASIQ